MAKIIDSIYKNLLVSKFFLNFIKTRCCKFNITFFHIFYDWALLFCCDEPNLIVWHFVIKNSLKNISWVYNFLLNSVLTHRVVKKQRIWLGTKPISYHMGIFLTHNILKLCQTIQEYCCRINPNSTLLLENNHSQQISYMCKVILYRFFSHLDKLFVIVCYVFSYILIVETYKCKIMLFGN